MKKETTPEQDSQATAAQKKTRGTSKSSELRHSKQKEEEIKRKEEENKVIAEWLMTCSPYESETLGLFLRCVRRKEEERCLNNIEEMMVNNFLNLGYDSSSSGVENETLSDYRFGQAKKLREKVLPFLSIKEYAVMNELLLDILMNKEEASSLVKTQQVKRKSKEKESSWLFSNDDNNPEVSVKS